LTAERPLAGAVAVVTGALGKLGPVWIAALADAGATVIGVDLQAEGAEAPHGCAALEAGDVTDRASLDGVRERVFAEHDVPSVLVNNAGIDQPPDAAAFTYRIEDVPLDDFRRTLDVNLAGAFNATQVFGAPMRDAGRGSIVNIGSLYASIAPEPGFYDHIESDPPFLKPAAYGASKAGVVSLTRYFARLWGPHGVRVNTLSPGGVAGGQDDEFLRKYSARVPLGRMAEPSDLTGPLVFLASDASRYVTGHELRVDGGFTA
jgi:NAD(P)-dependent dehydrogenase (short-subunit alcohol dehydrogenase family)